MALTGAIPDIGGATTNPITYQGAGITPGPVVGPGGSQGNISGPGTIAPFLPGPSLPKIPGATVTVTGSANPTFTQPPPPPAPTNAPAAPPGGGGGFGGQSFVDILNSLPGVTNALALEQQGLGQLDANLKAARERAIINFGDPALASMAGFGLDPQAGAFAQQNYLSGNATLARLNRAHDLASQAVVNQLASHGILNSGDLGYREGVENQNYGNNVYDAQQQVLQQLADLYNNYLSQRYGLESNANTAQLDALQSFLANPDALTALFGNQTQQVQQPPSAPKITPPKVKSAATTYAKTIKGPAIGAFK